MLQNLGARADAVLIGGKMAEDVRAENPFPFEVVLPTDVVAAEAFAAGRRDAGRRRSTTLPEGWLGLDIGPRRGEDVRATRSPARRPCSGTARWASSSGRAFAEGTLRGRAGRRRLRRLHGRRRRRLGARRARGGRRRPRSRGSRPAAAPRSSCSRARSCPGVAAIPRGLSVLIAGNWKMFKGPAEAGDVLPRAARGRPRRRRRRRLPAVRLARRGRAGARGHRDRRRRAERATGPTRARSPARSRRRCCASSASTARSSGTRSGASTSARPTRPSCGASRAALEHGLARDRLRRRDRGRARGGGDRGRAAPPGRRDRRRRRRDRRAS